MILVMAAGGNQGKILIPKLARAGLPVRAFRATAGREQELLALGATEVVSGNASDPAALADALEGVSAVYLLSPTMHPEEKRMGLAMVEALRGRRNIHLIYGSVLHPVPGMIHHGVKREIEDAIIEGAVPYTILQPSDYMLPGMLDEAFRTGTYDVPFYLDRLQSMVDLEDVTDVVVKVAVERERHFHATYQLTNGLPVDSRVLVSAIESVTGQKIASRLLTAQEFFDRAFGDVERFSYQYAVLHHGAVWYRLHDFLGNANVLEWLIGRPAGSIETFIAREYGAYNTSISA